MDWHGRIRAVKDDWCLGGVDKFVIPNAKGRAIKKTLNKLGINRASMFPDLDVTWVRSDVFS